VDPTDAPSPRAIDAPTESEKGEFMSVAKVIEITSSSDQSFEDAIVKGIAKASESVRDIRGAWVNEQMVRVESGEIVEYRTDLKVTFVLE
jgi:flavin-binding protein dodecin